MTPEQGYLLARFQRPGFKIVMGPEVALDKMIDPLSEYDIQRLPGHVDWLAYDLGFNPSVWARAFASSAIKFGHDPTKDEYIWLHGTATLNQAQGWLYKIINRKGTKCQK